MALDPTHPCRCHGEPMYRYERNRPWPQWYCVRARRATWTAAQQRRAQTAKGQAKMARDRARRIFVGGRCLGHAKTVEDAQRINAHTRRRLCEFKQGQSARAQAEGV